MTGANGKEFGFLFLFLQVGEEPHLILMRETFTCQHVCHKDLGSVPASQLTPPCVYSNSNKIPH